MLSDLFPSGRNQHTLKLANASRETSHIENMFSYLCTILHNQFRGNKATKVSEVSFLYRFFEILTHSKDLFTNSYFTFSEPYV